jgi:hypothetical protein
MIYLLPPLTLLVCAIVFLGCEAFMAFLESKDDLAEITRPIVRGVPQTGIRVTNEWVQAPPGVEA